MIIRYLVLIIVLGCIARPWPKRSVFIPKRSAFRCRKTLILFLSGAGGWVLFDRRLASELTAQGFDVLGMNTLRYFLWRTRSPEELTAIIQSQLQTWMTLWGDQHLIMIGYSQGADVLPFVAARLSPAMRNCLQYLVLLGPARHADFHLRLRDVIGNRYSVNARPLVPELQRLDEHVPVLCIAGESDPNARWSMPSNLNLHSRTVPGGHIFRHNARDISRLILDLIR